MVSRFLQSSLQSFLTDSRRPVYYIGSRVTMRRESSAIHRAVRCGHSLLWCIETQTLELVKRKEIEALLASSYQPRLIGRLTLVT